MSSAQSDDVPHPQVVDVRREAERVIGVTAGNWHPPGIEDSTPESLGMTAEETQKLRNGGLTDAQLARLKVNDAGGNGLAVSGSGLLR